MSLAGDCGATLAGGGDGAAFWFGEDQARYVLAVPDAAATLAAAASAGVPAILIGRSGTKNLTLPDGVTISLTALREAHARFFPAWMDG
jgi:phosphoribosylformylglycinamidine synthase